MPTQSILDALGPLAALYADPQVREIMVDSPDRVLAERVTQSGEMIEDTDIRFESPEALRAVIDAALALGGVQLGPTETIGDVRLPGSEARLLAVLPPTAIQGPCLVIRKMSVTVFTWEDLIRFGFIPPEVRDLLLSAISARVNCLITGGTGAGKTTVANILAASISPDQRLVVAEPVQEFQLQHPRAVFLEAGGPGDVPFSELISAASKMRPDWLVIGELIGPESLRAMEVLSRGHTAIITTHANSPEDALTRLEALCLMANLGLGLSEIRALIASAIRMITCQQRLPRGRRLTDIVELCGLENERYILQPLARYNPETDRTELTGIKPGWA